MFQGTAAVGGAEVKRRGLATAFAALALACAAASSGCSTVSVCTEGGHSMCIIENSGWKMLNFIPIASGNPDHPNERSFKLFRNTVTLGSNMKMLDWTMRKYGATGVRNLTSHMTDEQVFIMLFKRYTYHTSAELTLQDTSGEK